MEEWIRCCMSHENGYYQKAIMIEEGKHIGWIDLKNFDNVNKNAELSIAIGDKNFLGKGYGSLAIKNMLQIGFNDFQLEKNMVKSRL
ncbi:GNAT family N-acetyltransferase [Clostridium sp. Marseille-Q7071]